MLSRLLRRVLLSLTLVCAALGFLLASNQDRSLWFALGVAVQLLVFFTADRLAGHRIDVPVS